jgi:hypothetical protein
MAWQTCILVVANVTADSDELLAALRRRAEQGPIKLTLLVPQKVAGPEAREAASVQLERALEHIREAGLEAEGQVGDSDPSTAVSDIWDPRKFDEVIVSTLAGTASRWLALDLPHRLERMTGCKVTHVVAKPKRPLQVVHPPEHPKTGILAPLMPLPWRSEERGS